MREIKFRAWDTGSNAWFVDWDKGWDEKDDCPTILTICDSSNTTILEQYTGLKDKNGREIYEGDIVRFYFDADHGILDKGDDTQTMIDAVEFKDGCFVFSCDLGLSAYAHRYNKHCEVIGNIHENPELLNA